MADSDETYQSHPARLNNYRIDVQKDVKPEDLILDLIMTEEAMIQLYTEIFEEYDPADVHLGRPTELTLPESLKTFYLERGECTIHLSDKQYIKIFVPRKGFVKRALRHINEFYKYMYVSKACPDLFGGIGDDEQYENLYYFGELITVGDKSDSKLHLLIDLNPNSNYYGYVFSWNKYSGITFPGCTRECPESPARISTSFENLIRMLNDRKFYKLRDLQSKLSFDSYFKVEDLEQRYIQSSHRSEYGMSCGPWFENCDDDLLRYQSSTYTYLFRHFCGTHRVGEHMKKWILIDTSTKSA